MSKITEERTRAVTETYTVGMVCDICKKRTEPRGSGTGWARSPYEVDETTIQREEGTRFPDGGNIKRTLFDICPECFTTKLIPWMAAQGASPAVEEVDW